MPPDVALSGSPTKTRDQERKHDWLEAAESYKRMVNLDVRTKRVHNENEQNIAEIWETIGLCYSRASHQADNLKDFDRLTQLAVDAYETAAQFFEKKGNRKSQGLRYRCHAAAEYAQSWLVLDSSQRRERLDRCHTFVKKALSAFEVDRDELNYGRTCAVLLPAMYEYLSVARDAGEKEMIGREGIDWARRAVSILSKLDLKTDLILVYSTASLHSWYVSNISNQEKEGEELARQALGYSEKAVELSKRVADPYFAAMSRWPAVLCNLFFTEKIECSLQYANEMLEQGSVLRDNYVNGVASYLLAFVSDWMLPKESTRDKRKALCKTIINFAEQGLRYLKLVREEYIISETCQLFSESYSSLAREEISLVEKRKLLSKAIEIGREGLEHATRSGSPDSLATVLHALSKALQFYSDFEISREVKARLLGEALTRRKEYIKIVAETFPSNIWLFGVGKYYAGLVEADLSKLELDKSKKIAILKDAIRDVEEGIGDCNKWISSRPVPSLIVIVAEFDDRFGRILNDFFLLTEDISILTKATSAYRDAADKFEETDLPSRAAESYWKIARNSDYVGKHAEAARDFLEACARYEAAAQKIHQFADFYLDYAVYMKAWGQIEEAKFAHRNQDYSLARQHYEKAAKLLKSSKTWGFLASNFNALSVLEFAEDLSRTDKSLESIEAFRKAAKQFQNTKKSIEETRRQREDFESRDEDEMVCELVGISDIRKEYCLGRIEVEEAKILDHQGNHIASSRKYGSAVDRFQKASISGGRGTQLNELKPIISLCRAWQTMTLAQAEASPALYLEASHLFDEAKESSSNEKAKMLALGHSRFCKALEAGTRFEDTRDPTFHLTATHHLESAANYYIKAGFKSGSQYAVATQRLLDGYIYMDNASKETNPEKKAKYYMIAEKVLQTSAKAFSEARHEDKASEVNRLLDKVKERRELAVSLTEVLQASLITSSTSSFITPTSTHEKAVGLERFEHADIQAHLSVPIEGDMEEDLCIQLDLVNVAKNAGLLVRVDGIVPKGLEVTGVSPDYVVEEGSINMGGKRFEPLRVESIKISVRPTDFGVFTVSPKVIYVDDVGQFQTCVPKSVTMKVQAPKGRSAEGGRRKYEIVYRDLLSEHPQSPRNECRVAIAQIGVSTSGDVVTEFYEEKTPGIFGLRPEKVDLVRSKLKKMIEEAHSQSVNIVLFPELTVDLNYVELLNDVTSLAKKYQMYIIPGSYHIEKKKRNVCTVIGPDGILWQQEKHIPATIFHEGKRLTEGIDVGSVPRRTIVCNTEFGRIAILICRDFLDMDLRVELKNFEPAVDLVFNPAFTPVTADFRAAHFDARRSIYAYCFFANVAEFGDSFINTPEKERIERTIPAKQESIIYKDVDIFNLRSERKKWEKEKKQFIQSTR
jgi:predicted amidohydrolase/tetratricopeptide (TPR) repeat protein